jgi:hypothetical protein
MNLRVTSIRLYVFSEVASGSSQNKKVGRVYRDERIVTNKNAVCSRSGFKKSFAQALLQPAILSGTNRCKFQKRIPKSFAVPRAFETNYNNGSMYIQYNLPFLNQFP